MKVCIVGLGYVGLPLAIQFARSGAEVTGLDVDRAKVDQVNRGRSYIKHIAAKTISEVLKAKRLTASTDFSRIKKADAVIICVPTPLSKNREPDISFIIETGRQIAPYLQKGALVVLESTTYPGTTDEDLRRTIEENSNLKAGVDFHLAFSPEREDPGNPHSVVATIPKIVGGLTPACLKKAMALYSIAIKRLVPVSSCRVAEAAKLLEASISRWLMSSRWFTPRWELISGKLLKPPKPSRSVLCHFIPGLDSAGTVFRSILSI